MERKLSVEIFTEKKMKNELSEHEKLKIHL